MWKRIVSLILCAVVGLFLLGAVAEIDLSEMSYDELVALHNQVLSAMAEKPEDIGFKVGGGTYVAGKDFPVGTYRIDPLEGSFTNYRVYDSNGNIIVGGVIDDDDGIYLGCVEMLEGYSFKNDRGAHFSTFTGIEFDR